MAKQTKSKSEQTPTEPTPTPVQAQVADVQTKAKSVPKAKKASTPSPAPEPEPTPTPVVEVSATEVASEETPVSVSESDNLLAQSTEFMNELTQWISTGSLLKTKFKALEKRWTRELKNAQKTNKRKKRGGNHAPSGFVKPTKISDELARFLDKPAGTEMARTDVTREINKYIKAQNLQQKENGRFINPDAKLSALLKLKKGEELTYFNLQRYMSSHFIKTVKDDTTATA